MEAFVNRVAALILARICELRVEQALDCPMSGREVADELRELEELAGSEAPRRTLECGTCPGCPLQAVLPVAGEPARQARLH